MGIWVITMGSSHQSAVICGQKLVVIPLEQYNFELFPSILDGEMFDMKVIGILKYYKTL